MNPLSENKLNEIIAKFLEHPYQKYYGLKLIHVEPGLCKTYLRVSSSIVNVGNRLHAGVLYSALDATAFIASLSVSNKDEYPVTHNMNTSILSSATNETDIFFESRVSRKGKNIIFIDAIAYSEGDTNKTIAKALISKSILKDIFIL